MDKIDEQIKNFITRERRALTGRRPDIHYPSDKDFYLYLTDGLTGDALNKMIQHLRVSPADEKLILKGRELLLNLKEAEGETVPEAFIARAKALRVPGKVPTSTACPHCGKPITPFKKPIALQQKLNILWLAGFAVSFGLSFLFPRYFVQCVAAAVLFGVKWIVERRAAKTQILVYRALSESEGGKTSRLHEHQSHL